MNRKLKIKIIKMEKENKNSNLARYDFVEANPSKEARKDFYDGIKHLERGEYFEAGNAFADYKIGDLENMEFDAEIPSYFHRQVVEGHISNAIKNLNENDFYNTESDLEMAEDYLKDDAKGLERTDYYLERVEKLKKNLADKVFNEVDSALSKNELWEVEDNLNFLEIYFNYVGKSLKKDYSRKIEECKSKIAKQDYDNFVEDKLEYAKDEAEWELKWKEVDEKIDYLQKECENGMVELNKEQEKLDFYINNFDKFYELANFENESPVIGLEPLKNYDRQINQKEGEYLIDHKGNNKVAFGKNSLEGRLN